MQVNLRGYYIICCQNNPFANHRFDMIDEKNYYTISDYVSQHFGILIGETCTCLTCHAKKPKVLNDDSFIMSLEEISQKKIETN